jgi:ATP-dependent exoDNAse (exonuclease V) beta subunit
VFIVGDRKQSIYRFRDAEVAILDEASTHIAALRPGARPRRAITTSFRSPATLLAFVNDLFDAVEKAPQRSDAFRYDQRDRFPVLDEPWAAPLDGHRPLGLAVGPTPAETAARVADEIVRLVSAGAQVRDRDSGVPRAVRPGDIAILFRSRESHREYEAALAARRVPTYVYKGLGFFGSDEIQDLSALIRFLAQPDAPAREAALLRSRFVRLSDAALVETAGDLGRVLRSPVELPSFDRLDPADRVVLDRARRAARAWLALADRVPPADLVDAILRDTAYAFEIRGARYAQARENVKKFRALLRRVQNRGYATLGRIADHLDRLSAGDESNAAIDALNAVNLMTVHASKGLEFPVVFVVNLTRGTGTSGPPVRVYADDGQGRPAVSVGTLRFEADEEEKRRDREETKRLLYVAVTRARDRLYLATALGADGRLVAAPGSLAEVLPRSFSAVFGTAVDGEATLEWRGATRVHTFRRVPEARELVELPPESPAAVAIDLLRPVAATPLVHATTVRAAARAERPWSPGPPWEGGHAGDTLTGRLVHRLFQWFDPSGPPGPGESTAGVRDGGGLDGSGVPSLPDRPGGQSGGTGRPPIDNESLLRVARRLVLDEEHAAAGDLEEILRSACATWRALRGRPDVESLFAGARASYEVPFSLCLGGPGTGETLHVVRGTIDCLIERPGGEVVVVEVKSGRPAAWHHDQLALYVRAAQALMPGARVTGVLLGPAR